MAQVITNAAVTIGGVDLSQHITKVTLSSTRAEIETTTFGNTAKRRVGGLADNSVSLDFNNDYTGVANVESTLYSNSLPKSVFAIPSTGLPTAAR
jgi:hypothetical protein